MIRGIGVDICSISRMKNAIAKKGFTERVFSQEEISYANSTACPEEHFAAAYAAKEAFGKALGLGLVPAVETVTITRTEQGPKFVFTKQILKNDERVFLSISHDGDYAIAYVIVEGE